MAADRSENARIGGKYRARHAWERGEGADRMKTADVALGTDAPLAQVYKTRSWGAAERDATLQPTSTGATWETLPDVERAAAERALKIQTGGDVEFMSRAYGAAMDQKYVNAPKAPLGGSLATPYTTPPTRPVPERAPKGVVFGAAIKRPDQHVARPAAETLKAVKDSVPTGAKSPANELLPHLNVSDDEIAEQVPNFTAAAEFAKKKARQTRGMA